MLGAKRLDCGDAVRDRVVTKPGGLGEEEYGEPGSAVSAVAERSGNAVTSVAGANKAA
jgi:hypothetical protein